VFVPTRTGATARMISRFKPDVWIVGLSRDPAVCQGLVFSYGVHPVHLAQEPESWRDFARQWVREHEIPGALTMLVAGPSRRNPDDNDRVEFLRVAEQHARVESS
jgi:pyruvate kinase